MVGHSNGEKADTYVSDDVVTIFWCAPSHELHPYQRVIDLKGRWIPWITSRREAEEAMEREPWLYSWVDPGTDHPLYDCETTS